MKKATILLLLAAILLIGCTSPAPASRVDLVTPVALTPGAAGETAFTDLYVTGDAVVGDDVAIVGDLNVGADTRIADDLSVIGDISVDKWISLDAATAISVTAGATITPLQTYQPLQSASAVTTSTSTAVANGETQGDLLILINTNASDAITIDGAGANVTCGGDKALGTQDSLVLVWNGSDWVCVAYQNN